MPRPKNKQELLQLSHDNCEKLLSLVTGFSEDLLHREFNFDHRDRNVRDVLAHLHQWHLMMLEWHKVGMSGDKPDMPSTGYTWKTLPDLNKKIWEKYQDTTIEDVQRLFEQSYFEVRNIISKHSDAELFTKKFYKWTGTTSLGSYLISSTSSHYDWAMKLLRKHKKTSQPIV